LGRFSVEKPWVSNRDTSRWRGADILVFNTAHWWSHYKTKALKDLPFRQ
jgi:hypothetical protein